MVATISNMQELGTKRPEFELPDMVGGGTINSNDFAAKPMLVMFICNHCPYVVHLIQELSVLANEYQKKGVSVFAISSNDVQNYPQDGPTQMALFAQQHGFEFAYCYDQSQQVAKDFGAACTPDFFVYDAAHRLAYRGQMDDSRPGNNLPVSGSDLKAALDAVLSEEKPLDKQVASVGCNIKWKPVLSEV